jgi:hypothetical protein
VGELGTGRWWGVREWGVVVMGLREGGGVGWW